MASGPSRNAERTLHRWAERQVWRKLLPDFYEFQFQKVDLEGEFQGLHWAILPHELFGSIARVGPELFSELMCLGDLARYWEGAAANGHGLQSPAAPAAPSAAARSAATAAGDRPAADAAPSAAMAAGDRPAADEAPSAATAAGDRPAADAAPAACVPLGIHGDDAGVRSGGKEKILVLTWGAVAGKQNTLGFRLLFTSVKLSETPCVREVYRVLVWSMQVLFRGVYPDADHTGRPWPPRSWRAEQAGKPLALVGGKIWSGCWRELRGDWKWLKESLELERHYGTPDNMCHLRLPQEPCSPRGHRWQARLAGRRR